MTQMVFSVESLCQHCLSYNLDIYGNDMHKLLVLEHIKIIHLVFQYIVSLFLHYILFLSPEEILNAQILFSRSCVNISHCITVIQSL